MLNKISKTLSENNYDSIHYKKWDVQFRDDFFKDVYWSYFPITEKYYFEGNPAFIYEFKDMFDLGRYPITMIRDGFCGVLDFFLLHPKPPYDFKSILLLHKKMSKIVPPSWKEYVAFYQIQGTKKADESKENLIIHGLSTEEYFWDEKSPRELALELKSLSSQYKEITFLIPQRESLISSWEKRNQRYDIQFYKALYEVFGFDVKLEMNINEYLKDFKKNKQFAFLNLDKFLGFVADNYIDHFFFSKGGLSLSRFHDLPIKKESLSYKLSPHHDLIITTESHIGKDFLKYYLPFRKYGGNASIYAIYKSEALRKVYLDN